MAIFNGSTKIALGFGLGVVAASAVRQILPAFRGLGRPLLKATVKSGLILAQEGRVKLAEFRETLADVAAEAQAELNQDAAPVPPRTEVRPEVADTAGVM